MCKWISFKYTIVITLLAFLSILFTGCNSIINLDIHKNNHQILSVSCFEKNANVSLYKLDTKSSKAKLLKTQVAPKNFISNVLSDDGNLYYPKIDSSGQFVQLFKFNLASQKESQLTSQQKNNVVLVEHLCIDNLTSKIFMRIIRTNHDNCELASYNLKTGKMKIFGNNDYDTEILNFDICSYKSLIAVATYSKSKELDNIEKADKTNSTLQALQYNFTIYNENGDKIKTCKPIENFVNDISLSPDGKLLLISINAEWLDDTHNNKNTFYTENIQSGLIKPILKSSNKIQEIKNGKFSADGKGFFYLGIKSDANYFINNGGYKKIPNTIFYYNLKTNQSTEIWGDNNKTITNYVVLNK